MKAILQFGMMVLFSMCSGCNGEKGGDAKPVEGEYYDKFSELRIFIEFERNDLVREVANEDSSAAAYQLGMRYMSFGLPEAAVYWFKRAKDMGHPDVSVELLLGIENGVLDELR